jgi:tryptophan synthase beta subunit
MPVLRYGPRQRSRLGGAAQKRRGECAVAGTAPYLLQDDDRQIIEAHSISAGPDYPGIGPEHSWLHDIGRVEYVSATDEEALAAFQLCTRTEGIIPALEPAHALAHVTKLAPTMGKRHHPDESVRSRRQGYLHGGRASRGEAVMRGMHRRSPGAAR